MKKLPRRLGCVAGFFVWLFVMILPILACVLISRGQLTWGGNQQDQIRVFLLQEPDLEGIGYQWTRPANDDATCIRTTVRYPIMFEGVAEDSDSCQCMTTDIPPEDVPPLCALPEVE